jgi:hypothetical protein
MALCISALVIEILRGLHGNDLSWVYVIEWPILGATGSWLWWRLLHEDDRHRDEEARRAMHRALDAVADGKRDASLPE